MFAVPAAPSIASLSYPLSDLLHALLEDLGLFLIEQSLDIVELSRSERLERITELARQAPHLRAGLFDDRVDLRPLLIGQIHPSDSTPDDPGVHVRGPLLDELADMLSHYKSRAEESDGDTAYKEQYHPDPYPRLSFHNITFLFRYTNGDEKSMLAGSSRNFIARSWYVTSPEESVQATRTIAAAVAATDTRSTSLLNPFVTGDSIGVVCISDMTPAVQSSPGTSPSGFL